ncbi:MmgE/PrpD family protein, partial [Chloroflexota bacterium]
SMGGTSESTVVNYGDKTNAFNAAFLNASFGHGWDFDDMVDPGGKHTASACTAAAMALGERELISGEEILEAWVTGYEVSHRLGVAVSPGHMHRGFHEVGTVGSFAGSAASSKILRLDEQQTENALAITVSQAAGTFQHSQTTGGAIKRCHSGFAASNGIRAAMLAKEGITGPKEALEGKRGFILCHAGEENDMEAITRDLNKLWYTTTAAIKNYSCCAAQWGILDVTYALKKKHEFSPEDIESIKIRVSQLPVWMIGTIKGEDVQDIFGAQFSGRFGIGLALIVGSNRIRAYQRNIPPFGKWKEVVEIAQKVEIAMDEEAESISQKTGNSSYAIGEIKLKDGQVFKGESGWPKGFVANPMTRQERLDKFYGQALIVITKEKADKIVAMVEKLEELDDIRPIVELMVH